ncbi:unnamed protein product [Phytophthora fragariaefolia]|uniref:Unnamed protein product n=1 Tax=Phytophthora fragariaefolia TaxID=1490495 RepID=A0A9W6XUZ8_9STRA|nr:unnamed protein product [Phytophthora fragariaefolia]
MALESSSKKQQSLEGLSMLDIRDIFDALNAEHPGIESYLGTDAAVVHQPEFEDACVGVLLNKRDSLTVQQPALLAPVCAPAALAPVTEYKKHGFAGRAMKRRKILREQPCEYPEIAVIPPLLTSGSAFSVRQSMYWEARGNDCCLFIWRPFSSSR